MTKFLLSNFTTQCNYKIALLVLQPQYAILTQPAISFSSERSVSQTSSCEPATREKRGCSQNRTLPRMKQTRKIPRETNSPIVKVHMYTKVFKSDTGIPLVSYIGQGRVDIVLVTRPKVTIYFGRGLCNISLITAKPIPMFRPLYLSIQLKNSIEILSLSAVNQ